MSHTSKDNIMCKYYQIAIKKISLYLSLLLKWEEGTCDDDDLIKESSLNASKCAF